MNWDGVEVWAPISKNNTRNDLKSVRKARRKEDVAWAPAVVLRSISTDQLEVKHDMENGNTIISTYSSSDLHIRSTSRDFEAEPDDVTSLFNLSEPEVLHSLMKRYKIGQIYTSSSDILIAINPFSPLPQLFGPGQIEAYAKAPTLSSLPPHIFKSAAQAYRNLAETGKPQAILITGESGAGKTETAKCILCLLSSISSSNKPSDDNANSNLTIEMKLLDTNPLLEAFGNAKTVRNTNSSRFGKYIELQFSSSCKGSPLILSGALIRTYLLERSRVVHANEGERSFHIFYQLVAGATDLERENWLLNTLPPLPHASIDGVDDASEFSATRKAMANIGISDSEAEQAFQSLSAILHLLQVTFVEDGDGEGSIVSSADSQMHLSAAASLLGLEEGQLVRTVVTKTIHTSDGAIEMKLRPMEAKQALDSLSKSLYAEIFDWIISKVNLSLLPSSTSEMGAPDPSRTIGILDIYGFESLAHNDLEQLCINLTNEKLQQHFNSHVLSWEQREYEAEGIEWVRIDWVDNSDVIEVIEGRKVQSVMNLLDEAAKLPRTTPQELALKLASSQFIKASGRLAPALPSSSSQPSFDARAAFEIEHYAGTVLYRTTNMLLKNREASGAGSSERDLLLSSSLPLLQSIFSRMSNTAASSLSSVSSRFRSQLSTMMELISGSNPHFIRCIKPNQKGLPMTFDALYSLNQLRCGGIMEAVRIARAGYSFKQTIPSFLARFWPLDPTALRRKTDALIIGKAVEQFLSQFFASEEQEGQWAVGKTKVFLKASLAAELEKKLSRRLFDSSVKIQARWKGFSQRRRFMILRAAAITAQASFRARLARRLCDELRVARRHKAASCIQAIWRGRAARIDHTTLVRSATTLQTHWRSRACRIRFSALLVQHRAAIFIQNQWRLMHAKGSGDASDRSLRGERLRLVVLHAMERDRAAKAMQASWRALLARRGLTHLRTLAQKERFNQRMRTFNSRSQGRDDVSDDASKSARYRSNGGLLQGEGKGCDQTRPASRTCGGGGVTTVDKRAGKGLASGACVVRDRDRDQDQDHALDSLGAFQWVLKGGRWTKRSKNSDIAT